MGVGDVAFFVTNRFREKKIWTTDKDARARDLWGLIIYLKLTKSFVSFFIFFFSLIFNTNIV